MKLPSRFYSKMIRVRQFRYRRVICLVVIFCGPFHSCRKIILKRASGMEIAKIAINEGMQNLRAIALMKCREGVSTLEQVLVPKELPAAVKKAASAKPTARPLPAPAS